MKILSKNLTYIVLVSLAIIAIVFWQRSVALGNYLTEITIGINQNMDQESSLNTARYLNKNEDQTIEKNLSILGDLISSNITNASNISTYSLDTTNIVSSTITNALTLTTSTINTGQGNAEVYLMDQNLRTIDSVTFNNIAVTNGLSCTNCITLGTETNGAYVASITSGNSDITVSGAPGEGFSPTITLVSTLQSITGRGATTTNPTTFNITDGSDAITLSTSSIINLAQSSAPATTTDRLYNVAGNLTFNGVNLTAAGALPIGVAGQTLYNNAGVWTSTSNLYHDGTDIGIGETTPGARLEIDTDADATIGLIVQATATQTANLTEWRNSAGNITFATGDGLAGSEYVFNEQGLDIDFRWEANGVDPALFIQGSDGYVGIGNNPSYRLHVPWISGDAVQTSYFGSGDVSNNQIALYGRSYSSYGVRGYSTTSYGVAGRSTSSVGVYGTSVSGIGTYGESTSFYGVQGVSDSNYAVYGLSTSGMGVRGVSTSNIGTYGRSTTSSAGYFTRNNTLGTATQPVVNIIQDSSNSETNTVLRIQGDGDGDLVNIFDGGTEEFTILDGGNVGIGEVAPGARLEIDTDADATIGLIIQGTAAQSANLQEWQDSGGDVLLAVQPDGDVFTDRWQDTDTNTFFGIDIVATGNLGAAGVDNTGFGYNVMNTISTGYRNVAVGSQALDAVTNGYANTALGYRALTYANTGNRNVAVGDYAGENITGGGLNTAIGSGALSRNQTGSYNVAMGYQAGYGGTVGSRSNNTLIGSQAGYSVGNGDDNNVALGYQAGYSAADDAGVFLGYQAGYSEAGGNKLYIENSNSATPLIYGDFSLDELTIYGSLGIGNTSPESALHIPDGSYLQFEDNNAGAPVAGDCDADAERGRVSIDTTNDRLYICNGAARGWDYIGLTD